MKPLDSTELAVKLYKTAAFANRREITQRIDSTDKPHKTTDLQISDLMLNPESTGNELAQITRGLLIEGRFTLARMVMDLAIERGGDDVASLATYTEKVEGVAYGRMRLILGKNSYDKCVALCDLAILKLKAGDVTGCTIMFRRAVSADPANREAVMWFHLTERWGDHLKLFFLKDRPLPQKVARSLSVLLPDSTNGYMSPVRQTSDSGATSTLAA